MEDVEKIAAGLTKAQETACWNLTGEWSLAPHDGWRRSGQACSSLARLGLAERASPGTRFQDAPAYRLNPQGLSVQAALRSRKHLSEDHPQ